MATTVAEILSSRPGVTLAALPPTATVRDALQLMAERQIGSVLVVQGDALLGIFTERDYARKLALQGLSSAETMLVNVMTARLYVVSPRQTVQECLGIITKGRLRHLPVVDGGELVGLVSIGDLVNAQLEEQRFIISQMENYIVGNMGDSQF
ncbi:MAG: CBS domain-containing protein [Ottowia sp.]|jgi:CBS domain-containing protein|uniref:CBS domain-containing protein n=1 Tax=Ottowia beijingensis TaxID=1207057 RepID=A0A853ISZ2_9BURK|nr:CBS domain-containing protein [Ottowia beijingensis]MBP7532070.1 CBS domain-containing protein [Ottowia sp.]MBP7537946.1 CBS domain-containing protein [Ottowia sp.]MBP9955143.1 CBS domain-containing protein [Ottowia sp.]NZA00751.1 CBS domain-containing protein [Ottowia beijingensis]HRL36325.1 CBS domain-containing protein [Ottowia beijingensis]